MPPTDVLPEASTAPPRRTILAPLPDEGPLPRSSAPPPAAPAPGREAARAKAARERPARRRTGREEKPDSSTKAYLWRRNVRFIDTLIMEMEDNGARAGDINRSVVLRAAVTALEKAGLARELARCTNEEELTTLIAARLAREP